MLKRLWADEGGAIISAELVLILTITVIGMIVGLVATRDSVVSQLASVAQGIAAIDASFEFGAVALNGSGGAGTGTPGDAATGGAGYDATGGSPGDMTTVSVLFGVTFVQANGDVGGTASTTVAASQPFGL
jgi:hypothetical protein